MKDPTLEPFLAALPPAVRGLVTAARAQVKSLAPTVVETWDGRNLALGFGPEMARWVCVLTPAADHLRLAFPGGTELPDPAGLLEGATVLSRYVPIRRREDLERPELEALLRAAVARARSAG